MRSFEEIVVHERCRNTLNEFRFYSYKTDKLTGNVLPVLVDKDNHCIDSIRYALEDAMMNARRVKRPSISIHGMGF
jgi:phage terminase large subunit